MQTIIQTLSRELGQQESCVAAVVKLLDEGNTVPFIARYRKEQHGAMDDQTIRALADRLAYLRSLDEKRADIRAAIEAQGKLTDALATALDAAQTLAALDDLYRPYRPKRRTRASVARDKGLAPLAQALLEARTPSPTMDELAAPFICPETGVETAADALAGASDIIAEDIADDANLRAQLRGLMHRTGVLKTTGTDENDTVYRMYHAFSEPIGKLQSHRILAINRGEKEGKLKVTLTVDDAQALVMLNRAVLHPKNPFCPALRETCADSWSRLLFPSLARELRSALTDAANEQAIRTFALNLRPLLLQPPVRNRVTLGFDPGYRNGCKLAVVDGTGKLLETAVIYPAQPFHRIDEAKRVLTRLCRSHGVTCIAIGNGTASKESEMLIAEFIREYGGGIEYMVVSEAGASVYSASKLAAEEFPDFDVNLRSAVSIARRLQDPLAELVKIDPKAIGVGQYQHDMPQARLGEALDGVVEDCVSAVGVDLNTASAALLCRVAGISATVSKNIAAYREQHGRFADRKQLLQVKGLGPKAYEQCAGFLRVPGSQNLLDNTAVHPESYAAAQTLLMLCGYTAADAAAGKLHELPARIRQLGAENAAQRCGVGVPTLLDIAAELQKPGRDPRDELPPPLLRSDVLDLNDLKPGMKLKGTVRNVADFGAFVDIGVHQDGLVHISQLCDRFIRHPSEVVTVGDIVEVSVLSVDTKSHRISLSMKQQK
ncbi:MAG: RNA-binding transcriptional accessory protein [Agathobaculum sp.]|uniref:Tex family protein n=1 Tax=Agathobaculum sp. TaxID=2048138 RepID=UPI0025BF44AA|nr:Tex family protein [Agathobaculum sp.]MCI7125824.1 RNA-binding transcriptional accessory protein [Agathobaculum sp.]MDY3711430.1 Tex family protein [Agathobaculum sp.]